MPGDFTRFTFKPGANFAAVLQQQGRVQLDADWNEWAAIQLHRWRTQTVDTIGECGAPLHHTGFQVAASAGTGNTPVLTLTPGRAYVEGLLCELETSDGNPLDYTQQPHYPNPDPLALVGVGQQSTDLVYMKAWLRHVSALEDPALLEPALGGPDTATRLQTVWQVRVLPNVGGSVDCGTGVPAYDAITAPSGGRLTTGTVAIPSASDPCLVNPKGGYSGLENQLYRVEIHTGGALGTASFKWSRNNAAKGSRIETFVDGTHLQVESLGRDAYTQLQIGQWVEVIGDAGELDDARGTLAKITDIQPDRILTLSTDVSGIKGQANARVLVWDMADGITAPQAGGTIPTAAGPITLENGVTVAFSGTNFLVGDYWVFAARVAGGSANGPSVEALTQAPPAGIAYFYCQLALVTWSRPGGKQLSGQVQQCLPVFPPLTELPAGEGCCTLLPPGPNLGLRLQKALDAIAQTGGCVCIPAGDYLLERPLAIRGARRVTLCGCAGAVRLVFGNPNAAGTAAGGSTAASAADAANAASTAKVAKTGSTASTATATSTAGAATGAAATNGAAAAITIVGSERVTIAGVSLYSNGARALIEVAGSQDVEIQDAWLVNLPNAGGPSTCVAVAAGTDGVTLRRCSLLGDAALLGGPASFAQNPQGGVLRAAMERCRVLARALGVYFPAIQGLRIEDSIIAGLPAESWKQLQDAGANLSASGLPQLDVTLAQLFHAPPAVNGLVPAGVMTLSANQVLVARNKVWAGIGVAGVSVQRAGVERNLIFGLIGWLSLTSLLVDMQGNEIAALLRGVTGAGLSVGWQVRANRLVGRDGVALSASAPGQDLLARTVAALAKGLAAFAVGPDGVTMKGFDTGAATGAGGALLSALIAPQVRAAVARLSRLGLVGRAQDIAVAGNEIAASGLGIAIASGVRAADVHIRDNSVSGAGMAGISLLGAGAGASPALATFGIAAGPATGASANGLLVEGNFVAGSGLGITVETDGTTVAQNTVAVASAGAAKPTGTVVAGLFQTVAATQFAAAAATADNTRGVQTGFDQLALRIARGDLSSAEAGALATQASGPFAAALDGAQLSPAADNLRAGAAALKAGDLQTAAEHFSVAGAFVVAVLGNAGIRLGGSDIAAIGNAVYADGTARGGIQVGAPAGASVAASPSQIPPPRAVLSDTAVVVDQNLASRGVFSDTTVVVSQSPALRAVAVRDNLVSGGAGHGVEVGVVVAGLTVAGNEIRNMAGCGILVAEPREATSEVEVAHNRVEDCAGAPLAQDNTPRAGIALAGASQVRVVDNSVLRCGAAQKITCRGIGVDNSTDVSVRGNTLRENGGVIAGGNRNNGGIVLIFCQGLLQVTENRCVANQDSALWVAGDASRLTVTGNCFDAPGGGPNESIAIEIRAGDVIFSLNQIAHRGITGKVASRITAHNAAVLGNIWEVVAPVLPMPDPLAAARFTVIGNITDGQLLANRTGSPDQAQVNNVPHAT